MKNILFTFLLLQLTCSISGQSILTNPNKFIKGLKEGLWSEFNYSQLIDSNGNYHLEFGHHYAPVNIVAEGWYKKGEREGFCKEYWIVYCKDTSQRYCKGGVKSITEYKEGVPCGLLIEYHKNGNIRAIGNYETYPVNEVQKLSIPDWNRDPDGNKNKMKDTIIYIHARNRPIGQWLFFKPDGTAWK